MFGRLIFGTLIPHILILLEELPLIWMFWGFINKLHLILIMKIINICLQIYLSFFPSFLSSIQKYMSWHHVLLFPKRYCGCVIRTESCQIFYDCSNLFCCLHNIEFHNVESHSPPVIYLPYHIEQILLAT